MTWPLGQSWSRASLNFLNVSEAIFGFVHLSAISLLGRKIYPVWQIISYRHAFGLMERPNGIFSALDCRP
jgi:hypothetical protein